MMLHNMTRSNMGSNRGPLNRMRNASWQLIFHKRIIPWWLGKAMYIPEDDEFSLGYGTTTIDFGEDHTYKRLIDF